MMPTSHGPPAPRAPDGSGLPPSATISNARSGAPRACKPAFPCISLQSAAVVTRLEKRGDDRVRRAGPRSERRRRHDPHGARAHACTPQCSGSVTTSSRRDLHTPPFDTTCSPLRLDARHPPHLPGALPASFRRHWPPGWVKFATCCPLRHIHARPCTAHGVRPAPMGAHPPPAYGSCT